MGGKIYGLFLVLGAFAFALVIHDIVAVAILLVGGGIVTALAEIAEATRERQ